MLQPMHTPATPKFSPFLPSRDSKKRGDLCFSIRIFKNKVLANRRPQALHYLFQTRPFLHTSFTSVFYTVFKKKKKRKKKSCISFFLKYSKLRILVQPVFAKIFSENKNNNKPNIIVFLRRKINCVSFFLMYGKL